MTERIKHLFKKKRYSIPAVLFLAILLVIVNADGGDEPEFQTREAVRTEVAQTVSVTGNVASARAVDLAFERGGKIASLPAEVGEEVQQGEILAAVSTSDLEATLEARLVALEREKIELSELTGGASVAGRASAEIRNAETALQNARLSLVAAVNESFIKADDAIRNYADRLFENPGNSASFGVTISSGNTTYFIGARDSSMRISIGRQRRDIEEALDEWNMLSQSVSAETAKSEAGLALENLVHIQNLLSDIAFAINSLDSSDEGANAVYSEYKSLISTARSNTNSALTNLRSAIQTYNSAETALDIAEEPGSSEEIEIQRLNVRQAEADVAAIRADIAKGRIIAPVSGTITRVEAEVGEIVPANTPVVSVISESELQIEVNIPEADIAKVRVGAPADVTFDAYGSDFVTAAHVVSIDPAEIVIDGVPTYRAVLALAEQDSRIRSGLTADVMIKGERRENAIAVPQRSITTRDGRQVVFVLEDGVPVERTVTTGLRGSEGLTEIIEGISEGELIVTNAEGE